MPICISCSTPVKNLYTTYSKAGGVGAVRLTQCPKCKRFADKYVEHDFVVLFIDLVLIKPQVYRHLLFNRLGRTDDKLDPSILRLGILLVLFDVYLTWARIERANSESKAVPATTSIAEAPILTQYLFFLTLNVLATISQHATIRLLVRGLSVRGLVGNPLLSPMPPNSGSPDKEDVMINTRRSNSAHENSPMQPTDVARPGQASGSAISTALLVSSCMKLFPILLVIWPTQPSDEAGNPGSISTFASRASSYVGWAVLLNNIEALLILLDCGYLTAIGLAVAGALSRSVVEGVVLGAVGLNGDGLTDEHVADLMGSLGRFLHLI